MNITLIVATASLLAWAVLLFVMHIGAGSVNVLYAIAAIAVARRIIVGNPKFMS